MTIRQLLIGSAIGATALGTMLHRLPKESLSLLKIGMQPVAKVSPHLGQAHPLHSTDDRLSMSKLFSGHTR